MSIGILVCGFDCSETLDEIMNPWFELKHKYGMILSFVSCRFREYESLGILKSNVSTVNKLNKYLSLNKIDYLNIPQNSLLESEARNLALKSLLDSNVEYIILLDASDEFWTEKQIEDVISCISNEDNLFYAWFKVHYKNYIFDGNQWLDGFCPPRIFRTNMQGLKLKSFYWDNDLYYEDNNGNKVDYKELVNREIPRRTAQIKHITWTHKNGASKEIYQRKHFNGICSYKFNTEKNELEFDLDYYKKYNLSIPTIYNDYE